MNQVLRIEAKLDKQSKNRPKKCVDSHFHETM